MIEWFKKWYRKTFLEEDEKENIKIHYHEQESGKGRPIQARISYQYPQKDDFPLVKNRPEHKTRRTEKKSTPPPKRSTTSFEKVEKPTNSEEQVQQSVKRAFQRTDVPSPIYGFGARNGVNKDEVRNTPAYIRKRNNEDTHVQTDIDASANLWNEKTTESNIPNVIPFDVNIKRERSRKRRMLDDPIQTSTKDDVQKKDSVEQDEVTEENYNTTVLTEQDEVIEENYNTTVLTEQDEVLEETYNTTVLTEQIEVMDDVEQEKVDVKTESPVSSNPNKIHDNKAFVPFNVMMTPGDKKRLNEKKTVITNSTSTIPPLHLLDDLPVQDDGNEHWIQEQMRRLATTLKEFNVRAKVSKAVKGPAVTRFEVQPDVGVKVSKIVNLSDDIKLNLAAKDIRIEAPIPGKNAIGIEVPNQSRRTVSMLELIKNQSFKENRSNLSVALGLDIEGTPIVVDLKKMPHGLIAGATGSGKSVCINTILVSLLYKASPDDVKFLLIDPKMVELTPYNHLPHLVAPVITDVKAATNSLKWAVEEMEHRYEAFATEGVRDIERYNEKVKMNAIHGEKMPYIVIVIDELADLMMVSPHDVEDAICRIAQKARACGIHLLLATQRPSVDVITGLIKANIPTRMAFSVSSQVDSRTIIDSNGADKLLGQGDMLLLENGVRKAKRIQGAFVSDQEIERVTSYVKRQAEPNYLFEQEDLIQNVSFDEEEDDLLQEAIDLVIDEGKASTSLLQRRFSIGYNRAARLIDRMEEFGLISKQNGSKPREILLDKEQVDNMFE